MPTPTPTIPTWYSCGPVGGWGGNPFSDPPDLTIKVITVSWGEYVDRLIVTYSDGTKQLHGGQGGDHQYSIDFADDEYITKLSGRCGDYIDLLMISTNKRDYPPFGGDPIWPSGGNPFSLPLPGPSIPQYFFGRCQSFIDAIGINGVWNMPKPST